MLRSGCRKFRLVSRQSFFSSQNNSHQYVSSLPELAEKSNKNTYILSASLLSLAIGISAASSNLQTPEEETRMQQLFSKGGYPFARYGHSSSEEDKHHAAIYNHDTHLAIIPIYYTRCDDNNKPKFGPQHLQLVHTLRRIVGLNNCRDGIYGTIETKEAQQHGTNVLAIVQPTKLRQLQEILRESADAGCAILVQESDKDITTGDASADERPTVVISMKQFDTIIPIDNGERVLCLAGVKLGDLERFCNEEFDREPHAIQESIVSNPTTAEGVAYSSMGSQIRKGPAYTQRALYLRVVSDKYRKHVVKIVNTLGIDDFDSEEGEFVAHKHWDSVIPLLDAYVYEVNNSNDEEGQLMKSSNETYGKRPSRDPTYQENLCAMDETVSQCNTGGLDCNGSEGKVLILATVHDTYPKPRRAKTYWLSFDDLETATNFKNEVYLDNPTDMPVSMEFLDRDAFEIIDRAGRFLGHFLKHFGCNSPVVAAAWDLKRQIEGLDIKGASTFPDIFQYHINNILPSVLPQEIMDMGKKREYHVAMTVGDFDGSLDRFEKRFAKYRQRYGVKVDVHECSSASEQEGIRAFRFVAAAAFQTYCAGTGLQGLGVEYFLPIFDTSNPQLPSGNDPVKRMRYGHLGCNLFHEDLAYKPGIDTQKAKSEFQHVVKTVSKGKLPPERCRITTSNK